MKKLRKHPDGTMYPDVAPFSHKWPLATDEEAKEHFAKIAKRNGEEEPKEEPQDVADDMGDAGLGEKDPDSCESLEEAVAMVNTLTANECDAYAAKLGMEPFTARTKVAAKKEAIIKKMEEIAASESE
jgi:hypothetical protein